MRKEFLMKKPGNNCYKIEYLKSVVKEDIPLLPKSINKTIQNAINERLLTDPIGFGKPLRYNLKLYRSLRIGNYRVIYTIEQENHIVIIVAIKHRRYVYEEVN